MTAKHRPKTILLVGGLGTRLRPVISSVPKPLANVGGAPFLDLLIEQLRIQGFQDVVLCTGYMGEQIEREFGCGASKGMTIEYSQEVSPMGTGGAIKLAERFLEGNDEFLVMNGDSFIEVDLNRLLDFHRSHSGIVTLTVTKAGDCGRYGTVQTDASCRVTGFSEKTGRQEAGIINAGVYVFDQGVLDYFPHGPSSLEKDVFPVILPRGVFAMENDGMFIDIGTPEDYVLAQEMSGRLKAKALEVKQGAMEEECQ